MKKTLQLVWLLLLAAVGFAQNLTTVTATKIQKAGVLLPSGKIYFQATDSSDNPISFQVGGGGQAVNYPYCGVVVSGTITSACTGGTFQVANPGTTAPLNLNYRVTITDGTRTLLTYPGVQFTGATFNFDNYVPSSNLPLGVNVPFLTVGTEFLTNYADVTEIPNPGNPATGLERWYANNSTHQLSCLTSTGSNCAPGGGSGAFNGGSGSSFQDAALITQPANPTAGNARLYVDSGTNKLSCLLPTGASCNPTSSPGGGNTLVQYNNNGQFGAIAEAHLGAVLIDQGPGQPPAFADPLVQGLNAEGSTAANNPVNVGGFDTAGTPAIHGAKVLNSAPAGTEYGFVVRVAGTPAVSISGTPSVSISGTPTVTANLGTLNGAALDASVTGLEVAQGSTTSGQKGILGLAAVTTSAPTYTTAQSAPLSVDTSGNLRTIATISGTPSVSISGTPSVTIQSNASVNVNQVAGSAASTAATGVLKVGIVGNSGMALDGAQASTAPANALITGGVFNTSAPILTNGQMSQAQMDANGNIKVAIAAGGGSGGTASTFGAAFPSTGTAIGFQPDGGGNMKAGLVDASGFVEMDCKAGCTGASDNTTGSTAISNGTTNSTITITMAGENRAIFQLQSGGTLVATVTPQCSFDAGTTFPVNGIIQDPVSGQVSLTATIASAQGTTDYPVVCPQGASTIQLKATSYTSGTANFLARSTINNGPNLLMGLVTTSAPSYSNNTFNGISLDTSGNVRTLATISGTPSTNITQINGTAANTAAAGTLLVGLADGANNKLTTNSSTFTAKFALDGNMLGTLGTAFSTPGKVDIKGADGDVFVRQATASNLNAQVVGNVASAATDSGNPVKVGGVFNTTQPTVTNGQRVDLQATNRGALIIASGADLVNVNVQNNASVNLAQVNGNTAVTAGVNGLLAVGGNVAIAGTATANPVPIGGIFQTTPTTLTNGQTAEAQFDSGQSLLVHCTNGCAAAGDQSTGSTALGAANATIAVQLTSENKATFQLQSGGTGVYTITPQCSFDNGVIFNVNGLIQDPITGQYSSTATIASAQATTDYPVLCPQGSSHAQMKVTSYTSGTANWVARATVNSGPPIALGLVTTSAPSYSNNTFNGLSLTTAGALRVDGSAVTQPVSGTITANIGTTNGLALDTSVNGILLAQASTTSGQKGPLVQCAATTSAPSYTTAQTDPLSCDISGNLRTSVLNTVTVTGTVTANQGGAPWADNITQVAGVALGSTAVTNFGTAPAAAAVPGVNASLFIGAAAPDTNTGNASAQTQRVVLASNQPAVSTNSAQLNGVALGSPSAYGTSPGGVNVPGVNAFVTNTVTTTGSGTAGTPATGVVSVQGIAGMTPIQISGTVTANTSNYIAPLYPAQGQPFGTSLSVTEPTAMFNGTAGKSGVPTAAMAPQFSTLAGLEYNPVEPNLTPGQGLPLQGDRYGNLKMTIAASQVAIPDIPQDASGMKVVFDPCQTHSKQFGSINAITSSTQVLTGVAGYRIYFCSWNDYTNNSQGYAVVEGTGSTCATNTAAVGGFSGGTTAATGWQAGTNGLGHTFGNGAAAIAATTVAGDNVCILITGSNQINGGFGYVLVQ